MIDIIEDSNKEVIADVISQDNSIGITWVNLERYDYKKVKDYNLITWNNTIINLIRNIDVNDYKKINNLKRLLNIIIEKREIQEKESKIKKEAICNPCNEIKETSSEFDTELSGDIGISTSELDVDHKTLSGDIGVTSTLDLFLDLKLGDVIITPVFGEVIVFDPSVIICGNKYIDTIGLIKSKNQYDRIRFRFDKDMKYQIINLDIDEWYNIVSVYCENNSEEKALILKKYLEEKETLLNNSEYGFRYFKNSDKVADKIIEFQNNNKKPKEIDF